MSAMKAAIVGCGGIAQRHAEVLTALPGVELTACADIRPERAEALGEKTGARAYPSLEAMLEHEQPDVLHLCTPHALHTPMAEAAAQRGIQVFTEKPPVIDREQWARLQALEDRVRVGVCFQNRYNASVERLRAMLNSGEFGRVLGARAFVTWHREAPYYTESGWRGTLDQEGGGVLINQAVHTLDLLVYLLGPARAVEAHMANRHLKGVIQVEDTFEACLDFGEAKALFYATTAYAQDAPVLVELACEKAALRMEERELSVLRPGCPPERTVPEAPADPATGKAYWGASHGLCIADFYDSLREGRPFRNSLSGVRDTVELLLAAYDSARADRPVTL